MHPQSSNRIPGDYLSSLTKPKKFPLTLIVHQNSSSCNVISPACAKKQANSMIPKESTVSPEGCKIFDNIDYTGGDIIAATYENEYIIR